MRVSSLTALAVSGSLITIAATFSATAQGIDRAGIDASTAPGDDFWQYANGAWVASHPIPPDRSSYGNGAVLSEDVAKRTVDLIQDASKAASAGSEASKVGDFYASYMDEAQIEARGTAPLTLLLAQIAAVTDRKALATVLGQKLRADVDALNNTDLYTDNIFGLWVSPAVDTPSRYAPYLMQGGLGLPDREYYLSAKDSMKEARAKYLTHIAAVLKLSGISDAEKKATRILALETKIAQTHASRADSDDVLKGNNPWRTVEFDSKAPGLDWKAFFKAAGLQTQTGFIAWHPTAIKGISSLAASEPLEDWKDYLALRVIEHFSPYLPKAFVDERFAFYGKTLQGTPEINARWKRAVNATNAVLGEVVGKLYVEKYFPPESKAQVEAMVTNITAAFGARIDRLTWMAPSTKAEAKRKLASLKVGVGYPDKWRDYSSLAISRNDALGNLLRAEEFEYRYRRALLGQPVDRSEWVMTPQTVNAVNLPILNALNFPAAILQAPYFNPKASAAFNYGAIGATIGHEISHSFDDLGAQFDSTGRLRNWWTPSDLKQFQAAGEALAIQFDGYKPLPDASVNGHQTLSENLADLAGLTSTYDAYQKSLGGKPALVVDGLSGDQQFFLSYAQNWRSYQRPEALRQALIGDGHAPARYRASTVRNIDAWYAAFPVKPGNTLYLPPDKRVRVW